MQENLTAKRGHPFKKIESDPIGPQTPASAEPTLYLKLLFEFKWVSLMLFDVDDECSP